MNQLWKKALPKVTLAIWAATLTVVVASLMVGHWVSLPHPQAGETLSGVTAQTVSIGSDASCQAFHFLYGDCPCSRRVLRKVIDRQPLQGVVETIVFVGTDPAMETVALANGFRVDVVSREQLKSRYGVESAPLLVVTDRVGTIQYSGGYTLRKQGLDIQDTALIESVIAGKPIAGLPLYGCAVSRELKSIVDPLNIK